MSDEVESSVRERAVAALNAGDLETATILNRELVRLHDRMGITIVSITEGSAETTMELNAETAGSAPGTVHGGMLATFADVTAAMALTRSLNDTEHIQVTTDMHIRYFRQPKSGPLTARASVVHRGRLILSAECVICDAEGRDLARATATYMLVQLPS
ncbi:uncharacterized protein (TIGR00369 family) [Aeromicrobium panaciterrae]|uniref:Uncharacterized protein (TIGR00369 family) n=1 Tax=Aeromicrobium panaciterrae TaxID=363861 RepID=A0ABU1UKG1_9ACTN|nr:PaaI family thioesterase [Aeromicrobium panaciterrae]MDR7085657.1 uncharacterized protein (TIGR00369 family) [Aeromicrobium panaciterrae]